MCVVKTFREDRTLISAADYIADALGQRFVESVPLAMEKAWQESHSKCPLICLLSPGADPTKLIEDLAKKKKIKTLGVSMGQVGSKFQLVMYSQEPAASTDSPNSRQLFIQSCKLS